MNRRDSTETVLAEALKLPLHEQLRLLRQLMEHLEHRIASQPSAEPKVQSLWGYYRG